MKTRIGFVSNSSSTSFIVAVKKSGKITLNLEVDLEDFSEDVISTIDELDKKFNDEYVDEELEEEWIKERYNKCEQLINDGKIIIWGSFCDDSDNP